jgi:transglutaminase-like putative cysteine protease
MRYDIKLKIRYDYEFPASRSRELVRMMPADLPGEQRLVAGNIETKLKADEWINRTDFFNNSCVEAAFHQPHQVIEFTVKARVERLLPVFPKVQAFPLDQMPKDLTKQRTLDARSPLHFCGSSIRAPVTQETHSFAKNLINADMPVIEIISAIGKAIYQQFRYDPNATNVETPMLEAFQGRHGVCQDFAHIMISSLRGIGIPAGYVSGFLRTEPPKGKPRLEGADAMHAWICAWCGEENGWVEYDPTNGIFVGQDHIVIARGRDYFDVAPVKGAMRTSGGHKTKQEVDVIPIS